MEERFLPLNKQVFILKITIFSRNRRDGSLLDAIHGLRLGKGEEGEEDPEGGEGSCRGCGRGGQTHHVVWILIPGTRKFSEIKAQVEIREAELPFQVM